MRAAIEATNLRDNELQDVWNKKLINAVVKFSPKQGDIKAENYGKRESGSLNETKNRVAQNPQETSSQQISEVDEPENGPAKQYN